MKRLASLCVPFALTLPCLAAPSIAGKTDKPPVSYAIGEPIRFLLTAEEKGEPCAARVRWLLRKDGTTAPEQGFLTLSATAPTELVTSLQAPGFVLLTVHLVDAADNLIRVEGRPVRCLLGAGVAVDSIAPGGEEPADFDSFWAEAVRGWAALPLPAPALLLQPVPESLASKTPDRHMRAFSIPIGQGERPATGFVSWPKDAEPGSLPLRLSFYGYGMGGDVPRPAFHEERALCLDVNAHGFDLLRDPAYYRAFMNTISNGGEGGGYGFRRKENRDPKTAYFFGMLRRDWMAVRFAKTLPPWNGKDLTLVGASQGAFQAIALAALEPATTAVRAEVPWLCDLSGSARFARIPGFLPKPDPGLAYFDTVFFGRRVSAPTDIVRCGLADTTCPPSGPTALYNTLRCPKSILYAQGSEHMDMGPVPPSIQQQRLKKEKRE